MAKRPHSLAGLLARILAYLPRNYLFSLGYDSLPQVNAPSYCGAHLVLCSLKPKLRGIIVLPKNLLVKISTSTEYNSVFKSRQGHPTRKKKQCFLPFLCSTVSLFFLALSRVGKRLPIAIQLWFRQTDPLNSPQCPSHTFSLSCNKHHVTAALATQCSRITGWFPHFLIYYMYLTSQQI